VGSEAVEMKGNELRVKVLPGFMIIIIIIIIATATAKISSEMSAQFHQTTRRQISECDRKNHQSHISEKRREMGFSNKNVKNAQSSPGFCPSWLTIRCSQ
jgi:hypothetical protein